MPINEWDSLEPYKAFVGGSDKFYHDTTKILLSSHPLRRQVMVGLTEARSMIGNRHKLAHRINRFNRALFALQNCIMRKLNNEVLGQGFLLSKFTNTW